MGVQLLDELVDDRVVKCPVPRRHLFQINRQARGDEVPVEDFGGGVVNDIVPVDVRHDLADLGLFLFRRGQAVEIAAQSVQAFPDGDPDHGGLDVGGDIPQRLQHSLLFLTAHGLRAHHGGGHGVQLLRRHRGQLRLGGKIAFRRQRHPLRPAAETLHHQPSRQSASHDHPDGDHPGESTETLVFRRVMHWVHALPFYHWNQGGCKTGGCREFVALI